MFDFSLWRSAWAQVLEFVNESKRESVRHYDGPIAASQAGLSDLDRRTLADLGIGPVEIFAASRGAALNLQGHRAERW